MKIISYDLGTGGVKASLYNEQGESLARSFIEYKTQYPGVNMHEQRPLDWWNGVIESTKKLLTQTKTAPEEIVSVALSGHSLVVIPIDKNQNLLLNQVPIWSDTRAVEESKEFFRKIDEKEWYMTTGNGFPPACYSIFKLMWLKKHRPDIYGKTDKVIGSKDYINMMLTGKVFTDFSYCSGTGAYDLRKKEMDLSFLQAAELSIDLFPEIVPSHQIVGRITKEAASVTGLCEGTIVACGGVDNACMALGAVGAAEGKTYTSLGSSSWIAVNTKEPILDSAKKPYVFAHIEDDMYTSAFSIFSGGSSFRWIKENLCKDIEEKDAYNKMSNLAEKSEIGANGILFNPSLAGGTSQDKSVNIRGAFLGLSLGTTREDMIRAAMEGIALNLRLSLDDLRRYVSLSEEMLFCGGGSKNPFWMQMFADIYNMVILKTSIDQDAASLGAAAIAAKAAGIWKDYDQIQSLHKLEKKSVPIAENVEKYENLYHVFCHVSAVVAELGDYMKKNLC